MKAPFELWPALDLLGGRIVRLRQGDFTAITTYDDPIEGLVAAAARFADGLHVVDLDGARDGATANAPLIERLVALSPVPVEVGGGIRTEADVARAFTLLFWLLNLAEERHAEQIRRARDNGSFQSLRELLDDCFLFINIHQDQAGPLTKPSATVKIDFGPGDGQADNAKQ